MLSRIVGQYDPGMDLRRLALPVAIYFLTSPFAPPPQATRQPPASRIIAIGDIHGAFEPFVQILQTTGLIDANRQWVGGTTVLVQTGDIFDRGAGMRDTGVRGTLDLLMGLEEEAKRAGGRVEVLLGNHEVMNLLHEFRDVSDATYSAFADERSEDRRRRAYDDSVRLAKRRGSKGAPESSREEWMTNHPPGFLEYVDALGPRGKHGRWLRSRKVVLNLNGTAFMHAGVRPETTGSLEDINRTAAREIAAWDQTKTLMVEAQIVPPFCTLPEAVPAAAAELQRIGAAIKSNQPPGDHVTREFIERLQALLEIHTWSLFDPEGPLWFRGFAQWPDTDEPKVKALFQRFGVQRFVTGHTPSLPGRIKARFGNRIFLIDTGMLSTYFAGGRASALELQEGRVTAIYLTEREVLLQSP